MNVNSLTQRFRSQLKFGILTVSLVAGITACANQPTPNIPNSIDPNASSEDRSTIEKLMKVLPDSYKQSLTYVGNNDLVYSPGFAKGAELEKLTPAGNNTYRRQDGTTLALPPLTPKPTETAGIDPRVAAADIANCTDGGFSGAFDRVYTSTTATVNADAAVPKNSTFPTGKAGVNWMHAKVFL